MLLLCSETSNGLLSQGKNKAFIMAPGRCVIWELITPPLLFWVPLASLLLLLHFPWDFAIASYPLLHFFKNIFLIIIIHLEPSLSSFNSPLKWCQLVCLSDRSPPLAVPSFSHSSLSPSDFSNPLLSVYSHKHIRNKSNVLFDAVVPAPWREHGT